MFDHKKTAALLMSLLICTSAGTAAVRADDDTEPTSISTETGDPETKVSGIFTYSLTTDNTVRIENCSSTENELVIPETIDGIDVTELGATAFGTLECLTFEKISLPASIEYISANSPFSHCGNLTEITVAAGNQHYTAVDGVLYSKDMTELVCYPVKRSGDSFAIPEGVETICQSAFYLNHLKEITFPSTLKDIGIFSFAYSQNLTAADLSNTNLEYIENYAFSYCNFLSDVKMPDTLMAIGGAGFAGCSSITDITLPKHLQSVGQYAFIDTGLKKILIPSSVDEIGYCAFGYRTSPTGNEVMNDSFVIIGENGSAASSYANDSDTEYDYKNNFQFRTPEQDDEMSYLEGLTILSCGDYQYALIENGAAIIYCSSMDSVINVPAELDGVKITDIYPSAFYNTPATEINIAEGIENVRKLAFIDALQLKKVTLPQSVVFVEDNAFSNCSALESVDLGGAVTVGSGVFENSTNLKELTISGNCTSFAADDAEPFIDLINLEKITVTEGNGAFSSQDGVLYNSDKTVLIHYPNSKKDKTFTIPKSVKELEVNAFCNNFYLTEVDASGVEIIGMSAFEHCEKLKSVKLSKDLKSIGPGAFYDCKNMKDIRLYNSTAEIGEWSLGYYYDESMANEDGSLGGNAVLEGFKIYTNKSKNDTGVEYAEKNGIEAITNTVNILGKNIRTEIFWICGGGIFVLIAALVGGIFMKKARNKKNKAPAKKSSDKKKDDAANSKKKTEKQGENSNEDQ